MTDKKTIKATNSRGELIELRVQISSGKSWLLQYCRLDGTQHSFEASDAFKAMQNLREHLEQQGVQLLCAGARIDVYPSGMLRDMGGGMRAYVLRPGSRSTAPDSVDIFDDADPSLVGTVQQQREHFEAWLGSHLQPLPGEIREARKHPNNWVYRIAGSFGPNDGVPPEAIVGAWKVDANGEIEGKFRRNEKYDPVKWPSGLRRSPEGASQV